MANSSKGLRTEIVVALISLIGVVAVSVIENWDKIFARSSSEPAPAAIATPDPVQSVPVAATPTPIESVAPTPGSQPQPTENPNTFNPVGSVVSSIPRQTSGTGFPGFPPGFSQETDTPLNECTITIDRPLVRLMSEANHFSPSVLEVRPGDYGASVYRLVSIGGGNIKEGWFQTQVEGRTGWINSEAIGAKTNGCP